MKKGLIVLPLLASLVWPIVSIAATKGETADKVAEKITHQFIHSWNKHDMKALASIFAEDANFVNVVGMWWKSREEIQKAHEFSHGNMFKDSHLTGKPASVQLLRPDVAVIHMTWELEGMRTPGGKPVPKRQGIMIFVAVRTGDVWQVKAAQNTDVLPEGQPHPLSK